MIKFWGALALLCLSWLTQLSSAQFVLGDVTSQQVALDNEDWSFSVALTWVYSSSITADTLVYYELTPGHQREAVLSSGSFNAIDPETGELVSSIDIDVVNWTKTGHKEFWAFFSSTATFDEEIYTGFGIQILPKALTLLPVLVTVLLVLITQDVLLALFGGVYFSAFIMWDFQFGVAALRTLDYFLINALANIDHAYVIMFSWFMSGMVAVMLRSGGGMGLGQVMGKMGSTARGAGMACVCLGCIILFDDYSSTLIVGQTMRPVTDAVFVSREKLAFLTDATSAPIASISPVSAWIGFELSLIDEVLVTLQYEGYDTACYDNSAFVIFLHTIPSRYYPFFMIALQIALIWWQREFGPMLTAERRARKEKKLCADDADLSQTSVDSALEAKEGNPYLWWLAVIPIACTIIFVLTGMIITGMDGAEAEGLSKTAANIFSYSDSFSSLLWGSFFGGVVVWVLSMVHYVTKDGRLTHLFTRDEDARPLLTWHENIEAWLAGIRSLTTAVLVLILAWSIGAAFTECGTATYISSSLGESLDPRAYPVLAFVISVVLAAVTGTSWGTMAIMFPLVVPAAHRAAPCDGNIFYGTISSILAGSVMGDHMSPISDTTVLSAMSSKCDLTHHVKTQAPYALLCGFVSIFLGDLPVGWGAYPDWVGLLIGIPVVLVFCYLLSAPIMTDTPDVFMRIGSKLGKSKKGSTGGKSGAVSGEEEDGEGKTMDCSGNINDESDEAPPPPRRASKVLELAQKKHLTRMMGGSSYVSVNNGINTSSYYASNSTSSKVEPKF